METKTKEIRRYINIEFNEKDLKELKEELEKLTKWFFDNSYSSNREQIKNYPKILEFEQIILNSIDEIKT